MVLPIVKVSRTYAPGAEAPAPEPISVTNTDGQIDLSWDLTTGATWESYVVERSHGGVAPWQELTRITDPDEVTYTDSTLPVGATRFYRVGLAQTGGNVTDYSTAVTATVTSAAESFATSNFTGAANTQLSALANWHKHAITLANAIVSDANRIRSQNTGLYWNDESTPSSANYDAQLDLYIVSLGTAASIGPAINIDTVTDTCYFAMLNRYANVDEWQIKRANDGTITTLAVTPHGTLVIGSTRTARLYRRGDQLTLKVDGVIVLQVTDPAPLSAAGFPGIRFAGSTTNSSKVHGDNFLAEIPGAPADSTAPAAPSLSIADGNGAFDITITHGSEVDLVGAGTISLYRSRVVGGPYTLVGTPAATASPMVYSDHISVYDRTYYFRAAASDSSGNESAWSTEVFRYASPTLSEGLLRPSGGLVLSATYASIGIELRFDGDANQSATALTEYRELGSSTWIEGPPIFATYGKPGDSQPGFYGSVLMLSEGTTYEVRLTLHDDDTIETGTGTYAADHSIIGQVTTQTSPAAISYADATRFVSTTGNDTTGTGLVGAPWRTIDKALLSAPSGAIVGVAAGNYDYSTRTRTTPITFVGQNVPLSYTAPASSSQRTGTWTIINGGQHAVIEPPFRASPGQGTWVDTELVGPVGELTYHLWKWTNSGSTSANTMFSSDDRIPEDVVERSTYWKDETAVVEGFHMNTPEGFAEVLYRSDTYRYGWKRFGQDIYLRMTGDRNPNSYYWWVNNFGDSQRLKANTSTMRWTNLHLLGTGFSANKPNGAGNLIWDYCLFNHSATKFSGQKPSQFVTNVLFDHCLFLTNGFASITRNEAAGDWPMVWSFIKAKTRIAGAGWADDDVRGWHGIGKTEETNGTAILASGGWNNMTVRYCKIEGWFNGISGYNANYNRNSTRDTDVHDCLFNLLGDDALEPEGQAINWRAWNNQMDYTVAPLSTGPVNFGPLYFWRNSSWQTGSDHLNPRLHDGYLQANGKFIKGSSGSTSLARIVLVNNTFWTNVVNVTGIGTSAGGSSTPEAHFWRNNLWRCTRYITEGIGDWFFSNRKYWIEDYNHLCTSDATGRGVGDKTSPVPYRLVSGQGQHTNVTADFVNEAAADAMMVAPSTGDFTTPVGSALRDAGIAVPGITTTFNGVAPDIGWWEAP